MTEEKRIRDPNENKRRMHRCTRCKEFGHHRNSCKNPMAESSDQHDFTERGNVYQNDIGEFSDQHNPIEDRRDTKNEEGQSSIFREPQITPVGAPNPGARINLINVTYKGKRKERIFLRSGKKITWRKEVWSYSETIFKEKMSEANQGRWLRRVQ
ncbi:hypothetical protein QJS04_geneDACA024645 [Acorus gramineus]|uniref:CCHC-type domain-containing protein n=1 Tax=Acorus gramineus TaxID=55184 RepID=A0AAV8ZWI7_ACOGR|nr:hypothetical protein QJS04_geneDACA024645 [Acorus gramineus]